MTPEQCRAFARYNRWMNEKIYACAALLSDAERKRDRAAFFGSIHRTLNHILVGDRVWLGRLNGRVPEPGHLGVDGIRSLDQELCADFEQLRQERARTDAAIEAWAAGVSAEALAGELRMVRKGQTQVAPHWWAVAQLFNHQTHHRGQITTMLSQAGQDPGVTDLFALLMEEASRSA